MSTNFTHLHVHSGYSLLDGSAKIKEIIQRTKELGMDSIAITDHGVMFGVIDFYKEAIKQGIKPIIGCEVYMAKRSRFDKEVEDSRSNHLVLLAENMTGYQNLIKMVSLGYTEGFYRKPRIDIDLLKENSEGIIALGACLAGPVSRLILEEQYKKAKETAILYQDILGKDNFYLELQDHGIKEQSVVNRETLRISQETGIPLVATNDIHYIYPEDSKAHEILLCIQTNTTINDPDRMVYEGEQFYLKSPSEMEEVFPYAKEALENTGKIADRCNVEFTFNELKLPEYDVPEEYSAKGYLKELCYEGLNELYDPVTKELEERLEYELDVIIQMGFVDYFLIVWDFIKYAKDNNIPVGPGRGSAAGSIVAYTLSITNVDPVKYQLIFERFLNPERVSMPDIDIDFCYVRRQEVIDYVIRKYGVDRVAQIITFGTMAARAAIRDVGRALDMPYSDVDKIAKMIPTQLKITIDKALKTNPELKDLYDSNPDVAHLLDMSKRLEGLPRHASTHAAGVVISKKPVVEYVPLNSNDGVVTTQFSMDTLEELGLLKMDFLGLRTLTVIQTAVDLIEQNHNIKIDMNNISIKDKEVYELISSGNTEGVFQLESAGMKNFMKELQPGNLEDVIAGISLYRPGPMDFIPKYIKGKQDPSSITYTHPSLEPILDTTYGCIVYQEQVMQIVRDLGGYSLGKSDLLRRVMGQKDEKLMALQRENFIHGDGDKIPGCIKNGVPEKAANEIFDEMVDFAKYAFNKSHAAAYAVIAYETAWLKTHYPVEFMAALMTSVMDSTDKIKEYMDSCKRMGLKTVSPDINKGYSVFSAKDNTIIYGLSAIKNVGKSMITDIVKERNESGNFNSITDFYTRLEARNTNKRGVEGLILAGAFDSLGGKRSQYLSIYKQIADDVASSKRKNIEGQINLFALGDGEEEATEDTLPDIEELPTRELLALEKEALGVYLSGHPLDEHEEVIRNNTNANSMDMKLPEDVEDDRVFQDGQRVSIGGIVVIKKVVTTRRNELMAFVTIEDMVGTVELIVFPNIYESNGHQFDEDKVIIVKGSVTYKEEEDAKVICNSVSSLEELNKSIILKMSEEQRNRENRNKLLYIFRQYKGNTKVIVESVETGEQKPFPDRCNVEAGKDVIHDLGLLLGNECVVIEKNGE